MMWHNLSSQPINHPGCLLSLDLGAIVRKCRAVYHISIYGAGDSPGWRCAISYRHSPSIARAVRYRSTWVPLCANAALSIILASTEPGIVPDGAVLSPIATAYQSPGLCAIARPGCHCAQMPDNIFDAFLI